MAPPGSAVRPTSDRVREAIFNTLFSLVDLVDAQVVDLFAGSGALGIEALSRGAARATLVESDRNARATISANLSSLGLADRATVVAADAVTWAARAGRGAEADLVFADPPYRFEAWAELLVGLSPVLTGLAVLESDRELDVPGGWGVQKVKRYGGTVVTFCRGPASVSSSDAQEADPQ